MEGHNIQNLENNPKRVHKRWNTKIGIIRKHRHGKVQFLMFILASTPFGFATGGLSEFSW